MALLGEVIDRNIPVLGICRGLQLLNVFFGGSLYQNIFCADIHRRFENCDRVHETILKPEGFLYEIYQKENPVANSAHHQAVKELGEGLVPVQYSKEGIIEAFYHKTMPVYAVQWHPERMCLANARADTEDGLKVFEYFVKKVSRLKN